LVFNIQVADLKRSDISCRRLNGLVEELNESKKILGIKFDRLTGDVKELTDGY